MPYLIDFITGLVDKTIIKFLKYTTYIIILSDASQKKGNIWCNHTVLHVFASFLQS